MNSPGAGEVTVATNRPCLAGGTWKPVSAMPRGSNSSRRNSSGRLQPPARAATKPSTSMEWPYSNRSPGPQARGRAARAFSQASGFRALSMPKPVVLSSASPSGPREVKP